MKISTKFIALASAIVVSGAGVAQAAVLSASGGASRIIDNGNVSVGSGPSIISAPTEATDNGAFNTGIQAFDEQQLYTLTNDLVVDDNVIASGTVVSSHMVFLNSGPGNSDVEIQHGLGNNGANAVSFTFDGDILGVMSKFRGQDEVASTSFLGASGTVYPTLAFDARGMEKNGRKGSKDDDWYRFSGATIELGMQVTQPGDWIRVITLGNTGPIAPVPVPASVLLLGTALGGLGMMARRRQRKTS